MIKTFTEMRSRIELSKRKGELNKFYDKLEDCIDQVGRLKLPEKTLMLIFKDNVRIFNSLKIRSKFKKGKYGPVKIYELNE